MKNLFGRAYRNPKYISFVIAAFLLTPSLARADAGVPMLPLAYPVILIFLALVILIEAIYVWRKLHTAWWKTVGGVAIANGITMILGYPLMWLIYLLCEMILFFPFTLAANHLHFNSIPDNFATRLIGVVLGAAWMGPWPGKEYWPVLVAFVVLLIPSFFLSSWFEARFLASERWLGRNEGSKREVWRANILSYFFLAIAGCLLLHYQISHNQIFTF